MTIERLIIEADGGSRGNPGPSGSGAVVIDESTGAVITEISTYGGVASNNVAEYKAVIAGLTQALKHNPNASITVRMDSKLVVEQMSGNWKIKHPDMQLLGIEVQKLIAGKKVEWVWIPREQNVRADALANEAMDTERDSIRQLSDIEVQSVTSIEFNSELPSSVRAPGGVSEPLTTIILIRHGRTALTESHKISGGTGDDPSLSESGHRDAEAVAELLRSFGRSSTFAHIPSPTVILSSPMQRTRETASVIATKLGLSVDIEEKLREISFGDWDGQTNQQVSENWSEIFENWRGSWEVAPPNGESLETFDARIRQARERILKEYAGQTVVVVAHVMPIRGFLSLSLNAGVQGYWVPQVAPCSVTIIRQWGTTHAELVVTNFTSHL